MANAKKCDLCGKLYEHYNPDKRMTNTIFEVDMSLNGTDYILIKTHELCPECRDSFKLWLDSRKNCTL